MKEQEGAARVVAALFADPQPHIGKIYRVTGPQSQNMYRSIAAQRCSSGRKDEE